MINTVINRPDKTGFTLVELVMVIMIIGILAAMAMPKMVNLKTQAIVNSENNIIGQLTVAIKTKYIQNLASGLSPDNAWPTALDLFSLMEKAPTYQSLPGGWAGYTQDNITWRITQFGADPFPLYFIIACPHANCSADPYSYVYNTKGRVWCYNRDDSSWGHSLGDIYLQLDLPH